MIGFERAPQYVRQNGRSNAGLTEFVRSRPASEVFLPKSPNLRSNLVVALLRTSCAGVEPSDKLRMDNPKDVGLRAATVQLRQDRTRFGFVFVRVLVEINPCRVVPIEESGNRVEQTSVLGFEPSAVFANFIACFGHVCRARIQQESRK
jgi:hypothetical protein